MSSNNNHDQEANLLGGSLSFDKMREKVKDDNMAGDKKEELDKIMEEIMGYSTATTDMRFDLMANREKLVNESDIKGYESFSHNKDYHHKSESHRHYSDSSSSDSRRSSHHHVESMDDLMKDKKESYPTPKPGNHGPSYGEGPNIPSVSSSRYEGFDTEEELLIGKLTMLRKLGEMTTQHGVVLSQNYSMASSYKSMKYEFELHRDIRDKHNGTKWLNNLLCNLCYGIELGNDYFDPFGFKLDGWSQQMEDDKEEYYDVLSEIYEKYFKSGKPVPPEIKLGFMILSSAGKYHVQKTMFDDSKNLNEVMDENPELMEKLKRQSAQQKMQDERKNKQHEAAINKINDLNNLKKQEQDFMNRKQKEETKLHEQQQIFQKQLDMQEKQMEHQRMMQSQIFNKQRQLEELQKQLNQQRSDCRSDYTETTRKTNKSDKHDNQKTMKPPTIPKSLQNKFTIQTNKKPVNDYNNALNMSMGVGAIDTPYNSKVTIRDDIDDIISRGIESSYASSNSGVKSRRGRPKKNVNLNNHGISVKT